MPDPIVQPSTTVPTEKGRSFADSLTEDPKNLPPANPSTLINIAESAPDVFNTLDKLFSERNSKAEAAAMGIELPKPPSPTPQPTSPTKPAESLPAPQAKPTGGDAATPPAASAPAAPATSAAPELDDFVPGKTNKEHWAKLKGERNHWKSEAEKLAAQVKNGGDPEAIKAIIAERDELAKQLQQVAIERDPQFNAEYRTQIETAFNTAMTAIPAEAHEAVKRVLSMPPGEGRRSALKELAANLEPWEQQAVYACLGDIDRANVTRQRRIQESYQNWGKVQQEVQTKRASEQQELMKALEDKIAEYSDPENGLAIFRERPGDEAWNQQIEQTKGVAREILSGRIPKDKLAIAAISAAMLVPTLQELNKKNEKIAEQEKLIAELKANGPGLTDGGGEIPTGGEAAAPTDITEGMNLGDAIARDILRRGIKLGR